MHRIRETLSTMWQAARYSIAFCMRHGRRTTFARLGIALATAAISYLAVQTTGFVFNSVQRVMGTPVHQYTFGVFISDFGKPLAALSFVLLFGMIFGRLNWFFRSGWNNELRRANELELNAHRSTLDTARFRSKEYDDLSQHIEELPMGWQVRFFFAQEMLDLLSTLMSFVMFGGALLWYKPIYAVIIFVVSIPMMVMEFRFTTMWWAMYQEQVPIRKRRSVLERVYHTEVNFTQGIMFNQMPSLLKLIRQNLQESTNLFDNVRKFGVKREFITHFIAVVGLIGIIIHAVWSTVAFAGEFGTLSIVVAAARTFQNNLDSIVSMVADQWNNAKGVILIEKDFLGMKPVVETIDPIIPKFEGPPYIRFDRVCFTYPDTENQVLKDVSFTIEPGSKVAIVGKSGNGKSTLQALLMRHYDPTSGAIYVGDINLRNIRPADWTEFATTLMQKYRVLERLVGEEIASSRLDRPVDWTAVEESAHFADFHGALVNDPQGFRTQIGVKFGGREFSGGENQRLALARAHYRKTPIFILDEPDASLDPDSAQRVIDNMFALKGVTVIIITQHISRSSRCDKVIVMGKGEIVEQGRPDELMQRGGEYARLFTLDKERLSANT